MLQAERWQVCFSVLLPLHPRSGYATLHDYRTPKAWQNMKEICKEKQFLQWLVYDITRYTAPVCPILKVVTPCTWQTWYYYQNLRWRDCYSAHLMELQNMGLSTDLALSLIHGHDFGQQATRPLCFCFDDHGLVLFPGKSNPTPAKRSCKHTATATTPRAADLAGAVQKAGDDSCNGWCTALCSTDCYWVLLQLSETSNELLTGGTGYQQT